ncbi:MAG: Ferric siderophore transport system, periplasmic binding protein TonB [Cytophagales bacterium]|jgi:protein TonB|nr:TonB family protein [Bacteroidota bacterium]MBS1982446.1 TonB family protein [Bacteroidota bacterium]WHZ06287.1 MAG: Ferric siderophore transport system, periplasmic binding protein TonB [Cytophagales bacterium]
MSTQSESPISWDDIIFENRNKSYGAYFIRKVYSKNVLIACALAFITISLALAYPKIAEFFKSEEEVVKKPKLSKVVSLEQPPPINPDQPPPPSVPPPPVKTIIKFLPPKVTDKEVVEEEKMPTIEEIKKNETGSENVVGDAEVKFEEPVQEVVKNDDDANKVFLAVEQSAEPIGGMAAFYAWVGKNLRYPASARRMGLEGKVFLKFIIEPNGVISNVEVIRGFNAECDREAVRVLSMAPKWKPGKQSGRAVRQAYNLPIIYKIADQ